jgi:DNA-binding response OmpR family regulator
MTKSIKILVIDDDELVRITCRNFLKKAGYIVMEAENGCTGIALFKKETPDIVMTDLLMPEKEGLETIAEIRALNPNAKMIVMSGGRNAQNNAQNMVFLKLALLIGASSALQKPIKPDEVLSAVKGLLPR